MGVIFTERPDTIWLLSQGCSFAQAFSILERGGSTSCAGGPIPQSVQDATVIYLQENTDPEPEPAPPPPPPPEPEPEPEPEPVPEPVPEPEPEPIVNLKQTRLDKIREKTAKRRKKPIPKGVVTTEGVIQAGMGFHGIVDKPTTFLVGESGRERVNVTPMPKFAMDDVFTPVRSSAKGRKKDVFLRNTDMFGMESSKKSTNIMGNTTFGNPFGMGSSKKSTKIKMGSSKKSNIFNMGPIPKGIDSTLAVPSQRFGGSSNIFGVGKTKKRKGKGKKNNFMGVEF